MTPRLVLPTGPAAGEVAQVLHDWSHGWKPEIDHAGTRWDEVRDYLHAPDHVAVTMAGKRSWMRDSLPAEAEAAIRSLPGGEAFLVGLVLPECPIYCCYDNGARHDRSSEMVIDPGEFACEQCRKSAGLPARLAILAPFGEEEYTDEKGRRRTRDLTPALLVERVKAWGGEVWRCKHHSPDGSKPCHIAIVVPGRDGKGGGCRDFWEDTWPEAVHAALGDETGGGSPS